MGFAALYPSGNYMLIYLDMCCFNRPFDDQSQARIRFETEAKLLLQQHVREGGLSLVWSYILDYENSLNPFVDRKESIKLWRSLAQTYVTESPGVNTVKVARNALHVTLALRERAGVRETAMAAATYIFRGGADAMAVSAMPPPDRR